MNRALLLGTSSIPHPLALLFAIALHNTVHGGEIQLRNVSGQLSSTSRCTDPQTHQVTFQQVVEPFVLGTNAASTGCSGGSASAAVTMAATDDGTGVTVTASSYVNQTSSQSGDYQNISLDPRAEWNVIQQPGDCGSYEVWIDWQIQDSGISLIVQRPIGNGLFQSYAVSQGEGSAFALGVAAGSYFAVIVSGTSNLFSPGTDSASVVATIRIQQTAVHASIAPSALQGESPLAVTFTNYSCGPIEQYHWDFGNGQTFDGPEPPTIIYTTEDCEEYVACLTVYGADGSSHTSNCYGIHPENASFVADFTYSQLDIADPTVVFTDQSGAVNPIQQWWNFGDGSGWFLEENPTHTFPVKPGSDETFEVEYYIEGPDCDRGIILPVRVCNCDNAYNHCPCVRGRVSFAAPGSALLATSGATISGATVVAFDPDDENEEPLDSATTDADGGFFLADVPTTATELGVFAEVSYNDPATGADHVIRNYYRWDSTETIGRGEFIELFVPRPVVLQAGLHGGLGTWSELEARMRDDPAASPRFLLFPMPSEKDPTPGGGGTWGIEGYDNSLPWLLSQHDHNSKQLEQWVSGRVSPALQSVVGSEGTLPAYDLVCHSMGGQIARAWLVQSTASARRVSRVASLDGVHGGTTFAHNLTGFGEAWVNGWYLVAGLFNEGWNAYRSLPTSRDWLLYTCEPDKVVAPAASALGVGRIKRFIPPFFLNSGDTIRAIGGHSVTVNNKHGGPLGINRNPTRIGEIAQFLSTGNTPAGSTFGEVNFASSLELNLGRTDVRLEALAGTNTEQILPLDANAFLEVELIVAGEDAGFDLAGPAGSLVPPDVIWTQIADDCHLVSFTVESPPLEEATITLFAGATAEASLSGSVGFSNARAAAVWPSEHLINVGDTMEVYSALLEGDGTLIAGTNGTAQAQVVLPTGLKSALQLFDDGLHNDGTAGDGLYGGAFGGTTDSGRYLTEVHLATELPGGERLERMAASGFVVLPTGAQLNSVVTEAVVDIDFNGLYESLTFAIDIDVQSTGARILSLVGELRDGSELIASLRERIDVVGPTIAPAILRVDATTLQRHGTDGPWTLSHLRLVDEATVLELDTLPDHITALYPLGDFEHPPSPTIEVLSPWRGPLSGGNQVILSGTNLDFATEVRFGGRSAGFEQLGPGTLRATVPAGQADGPGQVTRLPLDVDVEVTTPWTTLIAPDAYTYVKRVRHANR